MHDDAMHTPPTPKTIRVTVPVTPEVLETFKRLAAVSRVSTGRAMGDWLADTIEGATLMASTMERAKAAPKVVTAEIHSMMLAMTEETRMLRDKFAEMGRSDGDRGGLARHEDPAARPIPPSSNTGGKGTSKRQAMGGKAA